MECNILNNCINTYYIGGNIKGVFYLAVLGSSCQIKIRRLVHECTCAF